MFVFCSEREEKALCLKAKTSIALVSENIRKKHVLFSLVSIRLHKRLQRSSLRAAFGNSE
jgi:hypothetical protein